MKYAVVRYPDPGIPALVGRPNIFKDEAAALNRVKEIEASHLKAHHTSLGVVPFEG